MEKPMDALGSPENFYQKIGFKASSFYDDFLLAV
jgi:hypothetical protein